MARRKGGVWRIWLAAKKHISAKAGSIGRRRHENGVQWPQWPVIFKRNGNAMASA